MHAGITPEVELAVCAHLLVPDMPESALAQLFDEHRVLATDVADHGVDALPLGRLAVRVGDNVYKCAAPAAFPRVDGGDAAVSSSSSLFSSADGRGPWSPAVSSSALCALVSSFSLEIASG